MAGVQKAIERAETVGKRDLDTETLFDRRVSDEPPTSVPFRLQVCDCNAVYVAEVRRLPMLLMAKQGLLTMKLTLAATVCYHGKPLMAKKTLRGWTSFREIHPKP